MIESNTQGDPEPYYTLSKTEYETLRQRIIELEAEVASKRSNEQLADQLCLAAARLPDDDTLWDENQRLEAENERLREGLGKALDIINGEMQEDDELLEELQSMVESNDQLAARLTTIVKLKAECYRLRERLRKLLDAPEMGPMPNTNWRDK